MKIKGLKEVDMDEISSRGRFNIIAAKLLAEFQKMSSNAAQVERNDLHIKDKKDVQSLYNSLKHIVKQEKLPVDVVQRKGEIYLIKK